MVNVADPGLQYKSRISQTSHDKKSRFSSRSTGRKPKTSKAFAKKLSAYQP